MYSCVFIVYFPRGSEKKVYMYSEIPLIKRPCWPTNSSFNSKTKNTFKFAIWDWNQDLLYPPVIFVFSAIAERSMLTQNLEQSLQTTGALSYKEYLCLVLWFWELLKAELYTYASLVKTRKQAGILLNYSWFYCVKDNQSIII